MGYLSLQIVSSTICSMTVTSLDLERAFPHVCSEPKLEGRVTRVTRASKTWIRPNLFLWSSWTISRWDLRSFTVCRHVREGLIVEAIQGWLLASSRSESDLICLALLILFAEVIRVNHFVFWFSLWLRRGYRWTKLVLQAKCAELGLTKSGRKADLVAGSSVLFMFQNCQHSLRNACFAPSHADARWSLLIHVFLFMNLLTSWHDLRWLSNHSSSPEQGSTGGSSGRLCGWGCGWIGWSDWTLKHFDAL